MRDVQGLGTLPIDDLSLLRPDDVVAGYRLIEALCDRANDPQAWRDHFVSSLRTLFDAAFVVSYLMRFTLDPGDIGPKTLIFAEDPIIPLWRAYIERGDLTDQPVTPFIMERFGTDFTSMRDEWLADETWYASSFYKNVCVPCGLDHGIYSQVAILRPGVVDGVGLARGPDGPRFTPREVALMRFIHQELARLWRKHDPLDAHTIPPRQREVMEGIRRGESRKAIATHMDVSEHTVHSHEKALFERAHVSSRNELQAALAKLVRPMLMP